MENIIGAQSMSPWISVNKASGFGNDSIQVICEENQGDQRTGSIQIVTSKGVVKDIYISQAAATVTYQYVLNVELV